MDYNNNTLELRDIEMKTSHRWHSVLLIGLTFLLLISIIACAAPKEKQEIIDYINTMSPVMGAHADWYDDQNRLFQSSDPDYSELMVELRDLLDRIEKIYMDVNTSTPPQVMREFKRNWSRECQLGILAVGKLLQAIDEGNVDLVFEAQELMFEANDIKDKVTEELFDILEQYNISPDDFR